MAANKSKVRVSEGGYVECEIWLDSEGLEGVHHFKHLDNILSADRGIDTEACRR